MKNDFIMKHSGDIEGTLSTFDRIIIRGTLPIASFAKGMASFLLKAGILFKDYTKFAEALTLDLRQQTIALAAKEGVAIEFVSSLKARKEDIIKKVLDQRGHAPGLVHILSAMETCPAYQYRFDKASGKSYLKQVTTKCLHYYFYFIDELLGLGYVRVPTYPPFMLQIYFNGHNWLANKLDGQGISYTLEDNAFAHIGDYAAAQKTADALDVQQLHKKFDELALKFCPPFKTFSQTYHWSIMQVEYATDIVFKDDQRLRPVYEALLRLVMLTVTPDDVAVFLGRKGIHGRNNQPVETTLKTRQMGQRIKHRMGSSSIKIYDKFSKVLRIETTTNNTTEFRHYRSVVHRDGSKTSKVAPVVKNIYSLKDLIPIFKGCNSRYLTFLSAFEPPLAGQKQLEKITQSTQENKRSYKGFNFFDKEDEHLLLSVAKGDFTIRGFQNKDLKRLLPHKSSGQVSRLIARMKVKGLLKKVAGTYRYYLTKLGQRIILTAVKLKELFITPELSL
jgi:hypothetical protein